MEDIVKSMTDKDVIKHNEACQMTWNTIQRKYDTMQMFCWWSSKIESEVNVKDLEY